MGGGERRTIMCALKNWQPQVRNLRGGGANA